MSGVEQESHDTSLEQGNPSAALGRSGWRVLRERGGGFVRVGQDLQGLLESCWKQRFQRGRFEPAGEWKSQFESLGIGNDPFDKTVAERILEHPAGEPGHGLTSASLEQFSVSDSAWARRFTGTTTEAGVDSFGVVIINGQASGLEPAHDMNTAARGKVFVPRFEVGGAGGEA